MTKKEKQLNVRVSKTTAEWIELLAGVYGNKTKVVEVAVALLYTQLMNERPGEGSIDLPDFIPGETVWYEGEKGTVLRYEGNNKYSIVLDGGPRRNRQVSNIPADQLGVYTELQRVNDKIKELEKQLGRIQKELKNARKRKSEME